MAAAFEFINPMSPAEIAQVMALTEANVLKIIQRANKKISRRKDLKIALIEAITSRGDSDRYRFRIETTVKFSDTDGSE